MKSQSAPPGVAVLLLAALALSACSVISGTTSGPIVTMAPNPGPGGGDDGSGRVLPQPGATVNPHPISFDRVEVVDDDTVEVFFFKGVEPCSVIDRVDLEEDADSVVITVFEGAGKDAGPDVACIAIAVEASVLVELGSPLGERQIVDGSV
jgi:hypothetical protein